jgi:hypothetical protein
VIDAALVHAPLLLRAAEHATLPALVQRVADAADPWKNLYGDSKTVATAVVFAHLGALFVGGGLALAADRATMRAVRGGVPVDDGGVRTLAELAGTHRPVVIALAIVFASGVLLFLSDVETFWGSPVYWIKMTLVATLLVNGWLMTRVEATLATGAGSGPWGRLRAHAALSALLWMTTLLAGVALANS